MPPTPSDLIAALRLMSLAAVAAPLLALLVVAGIYMMIGRR